jgi:hypothetical protein
MKYIFINLSFIIFFTYSATASTVATEDEPEDQNLAKYVSINIEIQELKESGDILKDATASLSLALKDASQNLDDLSPEQLVLINTLADKIENITDKLNLAMTNIPNTIKQAKKPTSELLNQSLQTRNMVNRYHDWLGCFSYCFVCGLCLLHETDRQPWLDIQGHCRWLPNHTYRAI